MKEITIGQKVWYQNRHSFLHPRLGKVIIADRINNYYVVRLEQTDYQLEEDRVATLDAVHTTLVDAYTNLEQTLQVYLAEVHLQKSYAERGEEIEA